MVSKKLPTRFVIATNTIPRLKDASAALAHRLLFIPFELSFVGREDTTLTDKLLAELPGIANWAMQGLRRLRQNRKFTLGAAHNAKLQEYGREASAVLYWIKERCFVHKSLDCGDLPPECITNNWLFVSREEAYKDFMAWAEANNLFDISEKWFGQNLKTILPKMIQKQKTLPVLGRIWCHSGLGLRPKVNLSDDDGKPAALDALDNSNFSKTNDENDTEKGREAASNTFSTLISANYDLSSASSAIVDDGIEMTDELRELIRYLSPQQAD